MNNVLWVITVVMAAIALLIVVRPFVAPGSSLPKAGIIVAMLVPGVAIGLYSYLGSPDAVSSLPSAMPSGRTIANRQSPVQAGKINSVANLLEGLEQRLEREPDDAGGWLLLAKSYRHLDRIDDARVAYAKAEAMGQVDAAFAQLLEVELASGSSQSQQPVAAPAIRGKVSMDAELVTQFNPTAAVFVFAKAVNGSPMPLAVVRKMVSELPFEFVLDDSLAMSAGVKISSAAEVIVSAKISTSGNALQPDAGFEATSGPVAVANPSYLELMIVRQN